MWLLIKPMKMINTGVIKGMHVDGCGVYYSTYNNTNAYNLLRKYETEQQAKNALVGIANAIQQEQKIFFVPGDEESS